jgi:hypothetical protein
MAGNFFWYDIMTTDTAAATEFYTEVIGWGATQTQGGGMDYTLLTLDGAGVAGLMAIPEEVAQNGGHPAWLGYVAVDDVDTAAQALVAAGGTLHRPPFTIPGIIRIAVVADPQGAMFYLGRGLSAEGPPDHAPGTPGTVGWHELYAADIDTVFPFYEKLFGWTKAESIDMGPMGKYQLFNIGGAMAGGMMNRPPQVPRPVWGYYFVVPALDAAMARTQAAGGEVLMGPQQVPGGSWIAQCRDPQGGHFAMVAPAR